MKRKLRLHLNVPLKGLNVELMRQKKLKSLHLVAATNNSHHTSGRCEFGLRIWAAILGLGL